MASQVLRRNGQRSVAYLPNIRAVIQCLSARCGGEVASITTSASQAQVPLDPQRTLGTYITISHWPHDPQFPLPGNVSVDYSQLAMTSSTERTTTEETQERRTLVSALLEGEDETRRKEGILKQFIDEQQNQNGEMGQGASIPCPSDRIEFSFQECPSFLRKGFFELFPNRATNSDALTVITISMQTVNDMTSWSEEVEDERDGLFETFVDSAKQFCGILHASGHWADFIDPSSGQAVYHQSISVLYYHTADPQMRRQNCSRYWEKIKSDISDTYDDVDVEALGCNKEDKSSVRDIQQKANDLDELLYEYFGEHTNATLFETDDRFNHLGFCVEDLGCCKVIRHKLWGSHVFVGTIFTDAPVDSGLLSLVSEKTG